MQVQTIKNTKNNTSFCNIKNCYKLGMYTRGYGCQDYIEKAFTNNNIIQNYCKKNDVAVSFITNPDGFLYYSAIRIKNILPKKPKNFFDKIVSIFKNKYDEVYIESNNEFRAYDAEKSLANKIDEIKTEEIFSKFIKTV